MFNKLKQFKDIRAQAKKIQNELAKKIVELEKSGIRIKMDGNLEIKELSIDPSWFTLSQKEKLEKTLIDLHNDTKNKVQRQMAEVMHKTGGFKDMDLPF